MPRCRSGTILSQEGGYVVAVDLMFEEPRADAADSGACFRTQLVLAKGSSPSLAPLRIDYGTHLTLPLDRSISISSTGRVRRPVWGSACARWPACNPQCLELPRPFSEKCSGET
jgi:hypothetical protein